MNEKQVKAMDDAVRSQTLFMYNLNAGTEISCLHDGENLTYRLKDDRQDLALRIYRPRFGFPMLRAETAWLKALAADVGTPAVVANRDGNPISELTDASGNRRYGLATRYICGNNIKRPSHDDYERLGKFLRQLHTSPSKILNDQAPTWIGRQRPHYDARSVVESSIERLETAPFLDHQTKQEIKTLGNQIMTALEHFSPDSFVHADLHFGNVLVSDQGWHCLDFDECGFGYHSFDFGIIRAFLRAANELEIYWPAFAAGYGDHLPPEDIGAGSALRIFYMMGKIPDRLDLAHIRSDPESFITRYLAYAKAELLSS